MTRSSSREGRETGTSLPPGWVRIDCHLHTVHSGDAVTTVEQLAARVVETRLDVICVTDHHTLQGAWAALERDVGTRIIVGEEIRTPAGEVIGLFLQDRVPYVLPLEEAVARIRAQDGIVYAPHPCDPERAALGEDHLIRLAASGTLDVIETFNAKVSDDTYNSRAAKAAQRLGIPGAAGSDAHDPEGIGAAYIEMPDFDGQRDFLAKLPEGKIVGALCPHTPRFRGDPSVQTNLVTEKSLVARPTSRNHEGEWSRLTDVVWLGNAGQCGGMLAAGATRLLDLRAETAPPRHPVPTEHFPIEDLTGGQEDTILSAATRIRALAHAGEHVGIYCQAGRSRTAAVAITYLMLEGFTLSEASNRVRQTRPQALPASELWHALKSLEGSLSKERRR